MKEKTIKEPVTISGVGVHTGEKTEITLIPETEGGINIRKGTIIIPASIEYVSDSDRGITISRDRNHLNTVEHLMAAFYGCGIDHIRVEVEGDEIPALDGSAQPFIQKIREVGTRELESEKKVRYLKKCYSIEKEGSYILARPSDKLTVNYIISYDHPKLSYQEFKFNGKSDFNSDIAGARTYGLLSWKDKLQSRGYAISASTDNTLVYGEQGTINKPRFPDEAVRHKILDFMGDMYLLRPVSIGSYTIMRGGHNLHIELLKSIQKGENVGV